jgi:alkylation response protein AidB-like acyl-CoA dehydrogenase
MCLVLNTRRCEALPRVVVDRELIQTRPITDPKKDARKQGCLGFMMPERFGGADQCDFRFNAILGEELGSFGYGYASAFGINVDVVSPYLRDLTTESQKRAVASQILFG